MECLVLSENLLKNVVGPGRPARGTLVSTVPTKGAEQKGQQFWKRCHDYFHENRKFATTRDLGWPFKSKRSDCSLQKRWGFIQSECSKFVGSYEHVVARLVSGIGVKDLVCF